MDFWTLVLNWLTSFLGLDLLLKALNEGTPIPAQAIINMVFSITMAIFGICLLYRAVYLVVGVFGKSRKYPSAPKDKRYCFIVPARNEELVIANLIDSVRALDYPQELIDVMVVADNCDPNDKTYEIAKEKGAIVFKRDDPSKRRCGYALQFMFSEFAKTHNIEESYYGYIKLDADNIVAADYLTKLNDCLQNSNFDAVITYRNAKNLRENVVSAMCGMNVYSVPVTSCRPRSIFKTCQQIYGPGTCYRSHLLKDGWNWTGLTEDLDAETDIAANNYVTGYCEDATFYEEEPTQVKLFVRQQMRWSKGNILSFRDYAWPLIKSFFKKPTWAKYDMFWQFFPYSLFSFYFSLAYNLLSLILFLILGDQGYNWQNFAMFNITLFGGCYATTFLYDVLTVIKEWKHFHLPLGRTIAYLFIFPLYQIINIPVSAVAAFMKVEWKHIDHHFVADAKDLVAEEEERSKKK